MRGRSRIRTRGRTGSNSLLSQATAALGTAPYHYWDFTRNRALFAGVDVGAVASTPSWGFARASTGYAQNSAGLLVPFASGAPRMTDRGILIEGARTNLALWSNDFTNAAWTKTTMTAALDQTAPDGVASSASSLTATAGNATVLQSITSAAANRYGSVWIKRITGSGNIDITLDGGAAWTTIAVTSSWTQLGKAQATVTNPNFGLRIVTNGDAVAVWCGQVESADFPSSPIVTTTVSATRAFDNASLSSPSIAYPLTEFAEFQRAVDTAGQEFLIHLDDATAANRTALFVDATDLAGAVITTASVAQASYALAGALALNTTYKTAIRAAANDANAARGGTLGTQDTSVTLPPSPVGMRIGARNSAASPCFGYIRKLAIFNTGLADAALQRATT